MRAHAPPVASRAPPPSLRARSPNMIRFSDESPADADAPGTPDAADTPDAATPAEGHRPPDTERLGDEIAELAAHIHAATYRLLVLLAEFDARNGWGGGGFRSCAHWLSWRTGSSPGTAREKMRVARALPALPAISAAMRAGELSYSKVRALTRVAEPATETELLEFARHAPTTEKATSPTTIRRIICFGPGVPTSELCQ